MPAPTCSNGGGGADYLIGFGGADTFAFTTALGGGNVDTIGDFVSGTDKIALDDAVFAALGASARSTASAVRQAGARSDADDRIIYDSATGISSTTPTATAPARRCCSRR